MLISASSGRGFGLLRRIQQQEAALLGAGFGCPQRRAFSHSLHSGRIHQQDLRNIGGKAHCTLALERGHGALGTPTAKRSFSTSPIARSAADGTTSSSRWVYAPVPHRSLLSLKGRDTFKLLQGLVSNDVLRLEKAFQAAKSGNQPTRPLGEACYAGLMNPQGRMICDLFLHPTPATVNGTAEETEILLEHDSRISAQVQSFIKKFKLRSKVKLEDVTDKWTVGQVFPAGGVTALHKGSEDLPALEGLSSDGSSTVVRDVRTPGMGYRVISEAGHNLSLAGAESLGEEEYTIHRILQGVPEGSLDIALEHSLPLEMNLDYMHGVDFRKGCYVGQELTARTHHTGVVRKRVIPISLHKLGQDPPETLAVDRTFSSEDLPSAGTEVRSSAATSTQGDQAATTSSTTSKGRGRAAGKWSGGIHNIGLACLRLEQVERWVRAPGEREDALSMSITSKGADGVEERVLSVKPWIPAWWPPATKEADGDGAD